MPWSKRFAEPILLPGGIKLATLRDAIVHLGKTIPKADRSMAAVLTAAAMLTDAAENNGPLVFARTATLQAINRHAASVFNSDRKDPH